MQVFNTFFKIAKTYKTTAIIYFTVFIILIICFSQMGASSTVDTFVAKSIPFTVIDNDNSKASQALKDYLSTKHEYVELKSYDKEDLQDYLYYETVSYILYIPEGYEQNIQAGKTDNLISHTMKSDSAAGYFFNQDVEAYLNTLKLYITGGYDISDALTAAEKTAAKANDSDVDVVEFEKNTSNTDAKFFYYFQYYAYVLINILLMGVSPVIITFRKKKLRDRLACSSFSLRKQSIQVGIASIVYAFGIWIVLMITSGIIYGFSNLFSKSGIMCMGNSLVYELVLLSITLVISSFDLGANGLNLITNIISLGSSFLCGVFVPLWSLSSKVVFFSKFLPTYWYITNNNMLAGFTGEAITSNKYLTNLGVQFVFILAICSVYIMLNKQHQKNVL